MALYTTNGDDGHTNRPDGRRVAKNDPLVEALGEIDELNSHIGMCLAGADSNADDFVRQTLQPVQAELLAVGVATGQLDEQSLAMDGTPVARMEQQIDAISAALGELTHFILPGGCELASRLHVARTVCRRCERRVVAASRPDAKALGSVLKYLNRLGDLLFVLARVANDEAGWTQDRR